MPTAPALPASPYAAASLLAVALAALASACWLPAETGKKMQVDILALQQQLQEANKGIAEQRAQLAEQMQRADKQIQEVAAALAELNRAAHTSDADFGVQMERLIKEVQELRGALELSEYKLGKLEAQLASSAAPSPPRAAEGAPSTTPATATSPENPADKPLDKPMEKKEMLVHARELAKKGAVGDARGVYRDIIKRWPDEVGTTDEAYYRLGDLYFDEKKYRSALQEYVKVAEKFANGAFADDAIYQLGVCSQELGNLEDAQIFFSEIIKAHKKSPRAKAAADRLEEVKKRLEDEKKNKKSGKRK